MSGVIGKDAKAPIKSAFKPKDRRFNLKMLFAGNSGTGKTELASSYTAGPVHFYMIDKGGAKTLEKNRVGRKESDPILSVDDLSSSDIKFSDFWSQLQSDDNNNFFESLAEENGLLVIDSITSLNAKALREISDLNRVNPNSIGKPLNQKKAMAPAYYGQLLNWMTSLTSTLQELPCAVIATVHIHVLMNSQQEVIARYPSVNGQFRQLIAVDFDEAYLLETRGERHKTYFKEVNKFEAKSRVFSLKEKENLNLDDLAKAYLAGKDIF